MSIYRDYRRQRDELADTMGMKPVKSTQGKHRTSIVFFKKKKKKKLKGERYSHFARKSGGFLHN